MGVPTMHGTDCPGWYKTVSEYVSSAYFQDNNYPAPHHIFASGETLEAGIAEIGVERNLPDDYQGCFVFNTKDTEPDYGTIANTVLFLYFSKPTLEYDSKQNCIINSSMVLPIQMLIRRTADL